MIEVIIISIILFISYIIGGLLIKYNLSTKRRFLDNYGLNLFIILWNIFITIFGIIVIIANLNGSIS